MFHGAEIKVGRAAFISVGTENSFLVFPSF